jgi:hypothetical protein
MNFSQQLAKQFKDVHFGGNWTAVNLQDVLTDVTFEEAMSKYDSFNTIAALVFHIHYYVREVTGVLEGLPLTAKDENSFNMPGMNNEAEWKSFLDSVWKTARHFAGLVENLPDDKLNENFSDVKYGTFYRNLAGITEHAHYHLGQIVILKKVLRAQSNRVQNSG